MEDTMTIDAQLLEQQGIEIGEENELILRNFSIKLEFDGTLDTQVLKDAASGLDGTVKAAASVYSKILGEDVRISRTELKSVKAGSCDFKGLSLVIEQSAEVLKVLKEMDMQHLFMICTTGTVIYSIYRVFNLLEKRDIAKQVKEAKGDDNSVHIEQLNVNVGEELLKRYPEHEKEVKLVADTLETMAKEQPKTLRNFAAGLTKLAHPGDAEVTSIRTSAERPNAEPLEQELLNEEEIQQVPKKLPKEEKAEPEQELYQNVQIEVVKIDKESTADNALQCRILDENYSNKKCPLIIHEAALRQEIMQQFPKNVNVDLYALKKYDSKGKMQIVGYVLKAIR